MTKQLLVMVLTSFTFPFGASNVGAVAWAPDWHRSVVSSVNIGNSSADDVWFNQRVEWKYGKEGLPWKTVIKSPDGEEYLLMLRPLWALEGGVLALEIVMARPSEPDMNILGQRKKGVPSPFVVYVAELEKGLKHSKFEARRTLQAGSIVVDARIEHFQLGKGVGSGSTYCAKCKNLQEISMWITIKSAKT